LIKNKNDIQLLFAGTDADINVRNILSKYGVLENCEVVENPSDKSFSEIIKKVFCAVNLRRGSSFETSGNMLKLMSCGKCVASFRKGSTLDYPSGSFYEIDESNLTDSLKEFFNNVSNNRELIEKTGLNASEYTSKEHDISHVADKFASQITLLSQNCRLKTKQISNFEAFKYMPLRLIISEIRRRL